MGLVSDGWSDRSNLTPADVARQVWVRVHHHRIILLMLLMRLREGLRLMQRVATTIY